jgi:hypothetical protein
MKPFYILALAAFAVTVAPAARAQAPSTRWGILTTLGTESGLGYQLPYTAFGAGVEQDLKHRVEIQGKREQGRVSGVLDLSRKR